MLGKSANNSVGFIVFEIVIGFKFLFVKLFIIKYISIRRFRNEIISVIFNKSKIFIMRNIISVRNRECAVISFGNGGDICGDMKIYYLFGFGYV